MVPYSGLYGSVATTYRSEIDPDLPQFQKTGKKAENAEIQSEPGFFRADICSGHRKPSIADRQGRKSPPRKPATAERRRAGSVEQAKELWPTREK